jgi:hypothetical protein
MHRADAEAVIAKRLERQRAERRLLLGKHRGDLAFRRAVDAGISPVRFPAIEVRLRLVERFETQPAEWRLLRVADACFDFALPIGIADATRQRAAKPWSSTRSCQMAIALRPRRSASMISSRYGSHALALGARPGRGIAPTSVDTSVLVAACGESESVDTGSEIAGFDCPESTDTSRGEIAGFALHSLGRPRPRTGSPAAFR